MAGDAALVGVIDDRGRLVGFLSKEHLLGKSMQRRGERPTGPLVPS
jgi:hypothetical protein